MENKPKDSAYITTWKLHDETSRFHNIENHLEDKAELTETINSLILDKSNIPELTNDLLYYIAESESLEESLAKQISVLQERRARFKKRSDNLRDTIKNVFERFDIKKIETPLGTVSQTVRTLSKLEIVDEGDLLMNHSDLYIKQEPKLDKIKLKALLDSGVVIEGVELKDTFSISIRR